MRFVDTNVLLYAISRDGDEAAKARAANAVLDADADHGISPVLITESPQVIARTETSEV